MAVDVQPHPEALGENPLIAGLERLPVPATTLTIFGATGDLAHRKLLPAIYNLAHEGALPERFNLVGIARREMPDEDFRNEAKESIEKFSRRKPDDTVLEGLLGRLHYVGFSFDDQAGYGKLKEKLDELDNDGGGKLNRAFYMSTAPEFFPVISGCLKEADLNFDRDVDVRAIIEKPFGTDLESALKLQQVVSHVFREQQVFRIDHYLGRRPSRT
jgi:glucose-6-phosphate 1-dehydrogenase